MLAAVLVAAAYLCGSVPTGVWVARRAGVDVRRSGSGNIGATNVARTAGMPAALVTLAGDIAKGLVPVLVAHALSLSPWAIAAVAAAAFLGHLYSVFLRFSGGKGVATAFGIFLGMAPVAALLALVVFAAVVATTRYVSLGSILASGALPVVVGALGYAAPIRGVAVGVAVLVVLRHRQNLVRLWRGVEPKARLGR